MDIRAVKLICATLIFCVGVVTSSFEYARNASLVAMILGGVLLVIQWFDPPAETPYQPTNPTNPP